MDPKYIIGPSNYYHIHYIFFLFQTVLVQLNRCEEALLVTEKYRIRAKTVIPNTHVKPNPDYHKINSVESILDIVNKQKASVLYFSIASGYLFSWLIVPNKGIIFI